MEKVIYGTYGVVNEGGTGVRARLPGLDVCGKTGTAQLASNEFLKGKTGKEFEDNAWFVGFAPREAPEIVVVALFEHGEHGQFAAPIVRDVMKAYFDKKARLAADGGAGERRERGDQDRPVPALRFAWSSAEQPEPSRPSSKRPVHRPRRRLAAAASLPRAPIPAHDAATSASRDLDWTLLIISLVICGVGVLQIFSATRGTVWQDAWWKQIIYIAAGLLLMWLTVAIDYHTLMHHVFPMYGLSVVALLGVLLIGKQAFGSRRWIPVAGGFHLQVSEFVKLVIILLVARFLTELKTEDLEGRDMAKIAGLVVVPMVLVMKQPDLGTALTYLPILVVGMFLAGMRWKYLVAIAVVVLLVLPVGWSVLKDYQKARLVSFLDPDRDPRGTGYQMIQSKIAVGAGGMWGKGVTKGSQTQLRFLPVPHTDFIFSAFAEEHGFVGVVVVLALYFVLIMQIVQNAQTASGSGRHVYLHGCGGVVVVSCAGERRDGGGPDAGYRHSAAADERRRIQCVVEFLDAGAGQQCPAQKVCELVAAAGCVCRQP